jgi:hypothetical protein
MRTEGYRAGGRYGQQINVFPDRELVVVYTAALPLENADLILDSITETYVLGSRSTAALSGLGGAGSSPNASQNAGTCPNRAFQSHTLDSGTISQVRDVAPFGDGSTTFCLRVEENARICLSGTAADAQSDYSNWGAGFALRLVKRASGNGKRPRSTQQRSASPASSSPSTAPLRCREVSALG